MQCLIVNGNLQFGKKWMAIDACSTYEVMQTMGTNVFYINLNRCRTKEAILEQMVLLYSMVAPPDRPLPPSYDDNITNKIVVLKQLLIALLKLLDGCLLILCNVLSPEVLDAFRLQCKIMVTTRNKAIQDEWPMGASRVVNIDHGLTGEESLELFSKVLSIEQHQLPLEAMIIHELCCGNPCLIWMVASSMQDYKNIYPQWKIWVNTLNKKE